MSRRHRQSPRPVPGSWLSRELSARADLARADLLLASTPGFPTTYAVILPGVGLTPFRDSWQDVRADVEKIQPLPFALQSS